MEHTVPNCGQLIAIDIVLVIIVNKCWPVHVIDWNVVVEERKAIGKKRNPNSKEVLSWHPS